MSDVFEVAWSVVKGSPVPDWARPKSANRRDIMRDGKNMTNQMKDGGLDLFDYGVGYNDMRVGRIDDNDDFAGDVTDFATGSYGDGEFQGKQTSGYYSGNPLDTRDVQRHTNKEGEDMITYSGMEPKDGRTSLNDSNKFLTPEQSMALDDNPMNPPRRNPNYNPTPIINE